MPSDLANRAASTPGRSSISCRIAMAHGPSFELAPIAASFRSSRSTSASLSPAF